MGSRRSRRDKRNKKKAYFSLRKCLCLFGVVVLIAVVWGYTAMVKFLHSEALKTSVQEKVSEQIGVHVSFADFVWNGMQMKSDSLSARGQGALGLLEVNGISLHVGTDLFKREVWEVSDVQLQTVNVELDLTKEFTTLEFPKRSQSWIETWLPDKAQLRNANVVRANVVANTQGGKYALKNAEVTLENANGDYVLEAYRAEAQLPFALLEQGELEFARLRVMDQRISLEDSAWRILNGGMLRLEGEMDLSGEEVGYYLNGRMAGLKCSDVINENWKRKLSGDVEATVKVRSKENLEPVIDGSVQIQNGVLKLLPILDTIAVYTRKKEFKTLRFSTFQCDFHQWGDTLTLSNIEVYFDGLMRVEGTLKLQGEQITEGIFQVGLNPGTLSHIPGAEEKVFLPGKQGMHWTTVRVSGTTSNVETDLAARLKKAAVERMVEVIGGKEAATQLLETGIGVFKGRMKQDDSDEVITESDEVIIETDLIDSITSQVLENPIEKGSDILKQGLDGLLGEDRYNSDKQENIKE